MSGVKASKALAAQAAAAAATARGPGKRGPKPLAFNAELLTKILANLELAMPQKLAVEEAGGKYETFREWRRRAAAGDGEPYASFSEKINAAIARAAKNCLLQLATGGKGSQGAQFILERRYREDFGVVQRIEHAGHDGGPLVKPIETMSDEELTKIARGE